MTRVKGSKQYPLVVVPYRPWRKVLFTLALVICVVTVSLGSFYWGQQQSGEELALVTQELEQLQVDFTALDEAHGESLQQLANLQLGARVDQQANEDVRQEVLALKSQVAELEEDISFYRGLMAPTAEQQGLSIGSVNVVATGQSRRYAYTIVVQQLAANHSLLNGYINVTVVGYEAGVSKRIPLHQLSSEVDAEDIKLRFKYFQTVRGELSLPQGFEPERIELVAVTTGRNGTRVEQKYGWLVQES